MDERIRRAMPSSGNDQALDALWSDRQYDELIAVCDARLEHAPLDATLLAYRGFSFFYKGYTESLTLEEKIPFLDEAVVSLRRAQLSDKPRWPAEVDVVLGKAYYHKGKYYYDLAAKYLERGLEKGYVDQESYDYLGLCYAQMGDAEKGLTYLLEAIELSPDDLRYLAVGQLYFQIRKEEQAEEYLIRAINKTADPEVEKKSRFRLGDIYWNREDYFKAEQQYAAILQIDDRSVDAHFFLGEIYDRQNDQVAARAEWRKAVTLDPNHHGAKLRLYE